MNNNTFKIGNFNAENSPVNLGGTIQGDQNATQNNYTTPNPQLESALQDLKNTLAELQQQHPNIATETEAIEIIDGELTNPFPSPTASKLVLLRQQFLNPERHCQSVHYLHRHPQQQSWRRCVDKRKRTLQSMNRNRQQFPKAK
jgi:hypothetical protein